MTASSSSFTSTSAIRSTSIPSGQSTLTTTTTTRAKRVTSQDMDACGERLRAGDLVAFPTETVYGLGCHALDEHACRKVFAAKERPLTDPLIVHVNHAREAYALWQATAATLTPESSSETKASLQARILTTLCDAFWPGPLTLVAQASSVVPAVVMAGTGYCAARSPRHGTARALIAAAAVPLAAPSANKFGHVSPTTAQHVWDDLQAENVWILEEDRDASANGQHGTSTSRVGVESSVVKLEMNQHDTLGTLTVLRQGAVSVADLRAALQQANLSECVNVVAKSNQRVTEVTATVAPGQTIRHYSPNVPSYLLSVDCVSSAVDTKDASLSTVLAQAVVLDYGQRCAAWQQQVLAYRDLSPRGDSTQAAQEIYDCLRWAEQVPQAQYILFPSLVDSSDSNESDALLLAVQDRLTRAASGVVLDSLDTLLSPSSEASSSL